MAKLRRTGSSYPNTAVPHSAEYTELLCNQAVQDLMISYRDRTVEGVYSKEQIEDILLGNDLSQVGPKMLDLLYAEARQISSDTKEYDSMVIGSMNYLRWADRYSMVANPRIVARFAIRMSYDFNYRIRLLNLLTYAWPTKWHWEWRQYQSDGAVRWAPSCWPNVTDYQPPLSYYGFQALQTNTSSYALDSIPASNRVSPFCELRASHLWVVDCIRPPLQSIRTAAAVIEKELNKHESDMEKLFMSNSRSILGIELGHSVAAQALSAFLPQDQIHTSSLVFKGTPSPDRPTEFDAAVVNLPNAATMAFNQFIQFRHRCEPVWPVHRHELDQFWLWETNDPGNHCESLISMATSKLKSNGILVVMGDIESGIYHQAANQVESSKAFLPVAVGGNEKPVDFHYNNSKVWGLYGALRPTGRLMGAWKKQG